MITEEQLAADKAAVVTAQAQLDKDQAAYDAVQPHLAALTELETYAQHVAGEVRDQYLAVIARFRSLF